MSDTLSETQGCDLLARLFRSRGYAIVRNFDFREYGVAFHADGWDAKARVGFEFLTSEDDDHDDLTLDEYKALMTAQKRGELALFIIDEVEPLSAAELSASANEFLDEVAEAVKSRLQGAVARGGRPGGRKTPAAGKAAAAKKPPAAKKASAVKKKAAKRKKAAGDKGARVATKASARKPAKRAAKKPARKTAKKTRRSGR
jgi:hypothetical protein